jgi:hypothetical protein
VSLLAFWLQVPWLIRLPTPLRYPRIVQLIAAPPASGPSTGNPALCGPEESAVGQVTLTGRLLRESRRQDPGLAIAAVAVEARLGPIGS